MSKNRINFMGRGAFLIFALGVCLLSLPSCGKELNKVTDSWSEILTMEVGPYKTIYRPTLSPKTEIPAYAVKDKYGAGAVYISGFDKIFEEGYEYIIKVEVIHPPLEWQDAEDRYKFLEVISKVKSDKPRPAETADTP